MIKKWNIGYERFLEKAKSATQTIATLDSKKKIEFYIRWSRVHWILFIYYKKRNTKGYEQSGKVK